VAGAVRNPKELNVSGTHLILCILVSAIFLFTPTQASAVPSFGVQTSQPCSACHVGSFGPRLKQAGRDFKLFGYAPDDNKKHLPPLNVRLRGSFTHTDADQPGPAAPGFGDNDNFTFDQFAIFYAGKVTSNVGAVANLVYNGIRETWNLGSVDLRYAGEARLFERDLVYGISINNAPTRQDLWEATSWQFPNVSSGVTRRPKATPIVSQLSGVSAGAGLYSMWEDTVYLEFAAYGGIDRDTLSNIGVAPLSGGDTVAGAVPYARLVVQQEYDEGQHFWALGTYWLRADIHPRDIASAGTNTFTVIEADAMYQWISDPAVSTSDMLVAHVSYLHERAELDASSALFGTNAVDTLSMLRVDLAYSFAATFTPAIQYFTTSGTADPIRWGVSDVDSSGWIAHFDYAPWGKPDSFVDWMNLRLSFQYIAYDEFNGDTANASDKNTFLVSATFVATVPK
jgi:hypothetical protein